MIKRLASMKKQLNGHPIIKWLLIGAVCCLASLGVFAVAIICFLELSFDQVSRMSKACYAGAETQGHYLLAGLPFTLPEQKDANMPVISDDQGMCDASPVLIFKASPEWISDFKKRYHLRETENGMSPYSSTTEHMERLIRQKPQIKDAMDACIWHPLVSDTGAPIGRMGDRVIDLGEAYVDEERGYVLLHFLIHGK